MDEVSPDVEVCHFNYIILTLLPVLLPAKAIPLFLD
jgi:hypothetical protein